MEMKSMDYEFVAPAMISISQICDTGFVFDDYGSKVIEKVNTQW